MFQSKGKNKGKASDERKITTQGASMSRVKIEKGSNQLNTKGSNIINDSD